MHTHTCFRGGQQVANKCSTRARSNSVCVGVSLVTAILSVPKPEWICSKDISCRRLQIRKTRYTPGSAVLSGLGTVLSVTKQTEETHRNPSSHPKTLCRHHWQTGKRPPSSAGPVAVRVRSRWSRRRVTRSRTRTTPSAGPHLARGTPACSLSCSRD